jgi:hypothetical protein
MGGGGVYINWSSVLKTVGFLLFCPFGILLINRIVCNFLQMFGGCQGVFLVLLGKSGKNWRIYA